MDISHFELPALDPVVITFVLAACFAVTCALVVVATTGLLGA